MKEGGLKHRWSIAKRDIYWRTKQRRWAALGRELWLGLILRHYSETCGECGRRYMLWYSPQPLWNHVQGRYGGLMCPKCFDEKSRALGYIISWTPMVIANIIDGEWVSNSNHWGNEVRDWLLMGIPDPTYRDHSESPVWADVRDALERLGYDLPDLHYYPPENFAYSRSLPESGASEIDRRAKEGQ